MKKNIKKSIIFSLTSIAACCIISGVGLFNINASAEMSVSPITMIQGASVRIGTADGKNGIRFSAIVDKTQVAAWDAEYKATYGMLIAPASYAEEYEFNYENVFGENAKYYWETEETGKKAIANLQTSEGYLNDYKNDSSKKIINGSIYKIKDGNLTKEFVGRAYVKLEKDGNTKYIFSDYFDNNREHNERSIVYVADQAIANDGVTDSEQITWLQDNYLDKSVELKTEALLAGEVNDDTITDLDKAYQEVSALFSSMSSTMYANIDSATVEAVNARIEEIREFKNSAYQYTTETKTENLNDYSQQETMNVEKDGGTVNVTLNGGMYALSVKDSHQAGYAEDATFANGYRFDTQSADGSEEGFNVYMPLINYTENQTVTMQFSTNNATGINLTNDTGSRVACAAGSITYTYDGAKLNVTLVSGNNTLTGEITDTDVITGIKRASFTVWGIQYTSLYISPVKRVTESPKMTTTATTLNTYVANPTQETVDGTHTAWVNGGVYALPISGGTISGAGCWTVAESTYVTNGLELQTQSHVSAQFRVYLPKINYTQYKSVSMEIVGGPDYYARISLTANDGGVSDFNKGTLTLAYDGAKLNATLERTDGVKQEVSVTNSAIINGSASFTFDVWGSVAYRSIYVGQINATAESYSYITENTTLSTYVTQPAQETVDGTHTAWVNGGVYALPISGGAVSGNGCWTAAESTRIENGLQIQTEAQNSAQYRVYLPKIDYTKYTYVSMAIDGTTDYQTTTFSLTDNQGEGILINTSADGKGTITLAYDASTATLNVTLVCVGITKTLAITDSAIISGTQSFAFNVWGAAYRSIYVGQIIGTVSTLETETVETPINDYASSESAVVAGIPTSVTITLNGGMYAISTTDGHQAGYTSDSVPEGYAYRFDTQSAVWCTNENAEGFNVYLPKINYTKYDSVALAFTGGNVPYINWQNDHGSRIALAAGTLTYTYDKATGNLKVTLVSGGNTLTGVITDSEIINGTKSASFTVWGIQYGSIYVSEVKGFTSKSSEITESTLNEYISNPTAVAVDGTLTAFVNGGVYAMPVNGGVVSGNGPWTIANSDYITNGLLLQTESQSSAQYRVYLPKLNYKKYKSVSMQIVGGPDVYATISLTSNQGDGIASFSNGTLTLAYDGAKLNATLERTDGAKVTLAITDAAIINGSASFTFDVWGGAAYRGIYVGQIQTVTEEFFYKTIEETLTTYSKDSDDSLEEIAFDSNGYVYADNVTEEQKFVWINDGDIYALPIIEGKISGEGAWVVGSDTYIANSLEIQTQVKANHNNATDFVVFLPKIDFSQYKTVSFKLNSNNAVSVGFAIGDVMGFGNNETTVTYAYSVASGGLTATMSNNSGTKSVEITDSDVICGNKRATFVIVGQMYTAAYISQLQGVKFDKVYGTPDYNTVEVPTTVNTIVENGQAYASLAFIGESKSVADEFRGLFAEMTGVALDYDRESTVSTNGDVMAVILRKTSGDKEFKLPTSVLTNDSAYAIKKMGTDVVIYSRTKVGLMDGIHGLLEQIFGLEIYTDDCYTYTGKTTVAVSDIADKVVVPSVGYSIVGWDEPFNNPDYAYAMGQELDYYAMGAGWHNMLTLISQEEFGASNPNWFSNNQLNLSYNDFEMVDTMVEKMKAIISDKDNADTTYFSITPADNEYWSNSATSQALKNEYGANSAEYIIFMNKVAEKINAWLATEQSDREIELVMFAYRQTLDAPVKANLTAEQQAMVTPYVGSNALVSVMIAPSYMQWNKPLAAQTGKATLDIVNGVAQESNYSIVEIFNNWKALTPNLHFWFYSTHYDNYLVPFDSISAFAANYQLAKSYNDKAIVLYQGQRANGVASDWSRLKIYLTSNLAKDTAFNVDTGIDNFMNAYFGSAATAMKSLFDTEQAWLQNTSYISSAGKISGGNTLLENYVWDVKDGGVFDLSYKSDTLLNWMSKIDAAYAALDTNASNYQILHDRIELESLTIRYLLVKVYDDTTYDADLNAVYAACQRLGMTSMKEGTNVWE